MFLKPAYSDTEKGINKIKKFYLKKIMYGGNSKTGKVKNQMYQNITVIGWLPNLKKIFLCSFSLKKNLHFLAARPAAGSDPPLSGMSS